MMTDTLFTYQPPAKRDDDDFEDLAVERGWSIPDGVKHEQVERPTLDLPFGRMKIGDSFGVTWNSDHYAAMIQLQNNISSRANSWAKKNAPGWKFATRCLNGHVRCWRIA